MENCREYSYPYMGAREVIPKVRFGVAGVGFGVSRTLFHLSGTRAQTVAIGSSRCYYTIDHQHRSGLVTLRVLRGSATGPGEDFAIIS